MSELTLDKLIHDVIAVLSYLLFCAACRAHLFRQRPRQRVGFQCAAVAMRSSARYGAQIIIESWRRHYNTIRPACLPRLPGCRHLRWVVPGMPAWPSAPNTLPFSKARATVEANVLNVFLELRSVRLRGVDLHVQV